MVSIVSNRLMANVAIIVGGVVGLFLLFLALIWVFQERVAFQPEHGPFPQDKGVPRVEFKATDGQPLFAYMVGDPQASSGLVIAFHGNADLAVRQLDWANEIHRRWDVAVMVLEYRGYMGLSGKPTYRGSQLDAEAAYQYAKITLGLPGERLAYFGHSLGTAIAAELADRHRPAALILQSPFTSARDMAKIVIGRRPSGITWNLISRLHFDTETRVASLDAPVSVSHGNRDRLIPPEMGKRVFAAAKLKGAWMLVPEASHNNVEQAAGDEYWHWMESALEPLNTAASSRK
jgi:uncharacterized protein